MKSFTLSLLLLGMLCASCSENLDVSIPDYNADELLAGWDPIPMAVREGMEGVYQVSDGKEFLGSTVVLKWGGSRLSVFSEKDGLYLVMECGGKDSAISATGYWRKALNSEMGIVGLQVKPSEGGTHLFRGNRPGPGAVVVVGEYGPNEAAPRKTIRLVYQRPLFTSSTPFAILAHRGGGRNSDRLPASENSVELVRIAEHFGATGVEVDVRMTRDGIPIIFHDEYLNPRLVQKNGLVGKPSDYTLAQLETFVRLLKGERIPTLRAVLSSILHDTKLNFVWLDIKADVPLRRIQDIQHEYRDSAASLGRSLTLVMGIPSSEMAGEFSSLPDYLHTPSLCELSVDEAQRLGSQIWAPRWTMGIQSSQVEYIHSLGKRAFVWTLDDPLYVKDFINGGNFDGILTNYPSIVAYYHYAR